MGRCFHPAAAACLGRRLLAEFHTASLSIIPEQFFSQTMIRADDIHSSRMSLWKIARGLRSSLRANSYLRTIAVMSAAVSPSLGAGSRFDTRFLPFEWAALIVRSAVRCKSGCD